MILLFIGIRTLAKWLLFLSVVVYMIFFAVGLGGTFTAYTGEVLPSTGASIALSFQYFFIGATGLLFPMLVTSVGSQAMTISFAIYSLFAALVMAATCVETKNKTSKQINDEFHDGKSKLFKFK